MNYYIKIEVIKAAMAQLPPEPKDSNRWQVITGIKDAADPLGFLILHFEWHSYIKAWVLDQTRPNQSLKIIP